MFCTNCGAQLSDSAKFCINCGAKLKAAEEIVPLNEPSLLSDDSEQTVLLSEPGDDIALNENFGDTPTVLLSEEEDLATDIASVQDTAASAADDIVSGFESDVTVSAFSDSSLNPDFDGTGDTVMISGEEDLIPEPEPVPELNTFEDLPTELLDEMPGSDIANDVPDVNTYTAQEKESFPEPEVPVSPVYPVDDKPQYEPYAPQQNEQVPPPFDPYAPPQGMEQPQFDPYAAPGGMAQQPQFDPYAPPQGMPQQPQNDMYAQPPQYQNEQPQYAEAPAKKKIGGGRIFGAVFISIITFVLLLGLSLAVTIKFGASGKTLRKGIEKLDKKTLFSAEYDDEEIATDLYKSLGIRGITDGYADDTAFKKYITETNILEYIGENVENYAKYIFDGKGDDPSITADDIAADFFGSDENNKLADDYLGQKFAKDDLRTISRNMSKNDVDKNLSIKEWNDTVGFELKNISYGLSWITMGILAALIFVLLIWIALIVDRRAKYVSGFFGTVFAFSGSIMFVIGLAIAGVCPLLFALTSNVVFYVVFHVLLKFAIVALCVGVGELFLAYVMKKIKKGIRKREKAAKVKAKIQEEMSAE